MGSKALSETQVRNLKPRSTPFKVSDGGGLHVLVSPTGGKLWRQAYRFDKKQQTLALGAYPAVSLADARKEREQAKRDLAAGTDPAIAKQERKRLAGRGAASSFAKVAEEWFDNRKGPWGAGHRKRVWGSIENDVIPTIGHLAINRVEPEDVLRALRRFESRGSIEMARRTRAYVEDIFRFAKAERLATINPAEDLLDALKRPPKPKHFAKFKAHELPEFLRKLSVYHGKELTGLAMRLTFLTMVRTTETRFANWPEFENWEHGNTDKALWRLSPERMKMDREHLVPLSRQAIKCLHQIKALSKDSERLFPAPTKSGVFSESAMLYVLYSMGYYGKATVHGLRGTASTILNENEFNSDWIEFQLAHHEEDEVRASYNSAEYLPQRRKMMQWWADYLDKAEKSPDLTA
jgi:integrase